jgi:transcriptional regulator with XRE-family HTH domain
MTAFAKKLKMSVTYLNDLEKGRKFASPEKAAEYARILQMSEKLYVQLAIQERLDRAGIKMRVEIKAA